MTVAVDFDGTITEKSPYPVMGKVRPQIKPLLLRLRKNGYRVVLNTCRKGQYFREALVALQREGLYNLFDWEYLKSDDCKGEFGKIVAAFYLDDSALPFDLDRVDWDWLCDRIVSVVESKKVSN